MADLLKKAAKVESARKWSAAFELYRRAIDRDPRCLAAYEGLLRAALEDETSDEVPAIFSKGLRAKQELLRSQPSELVSAAKVRHNLGQLLHLKKKNSLPKRFVSQIPAYRRLAREFGPTPRAPMMFVSQRDLEALQPAYGCVDFAYRPPWQKTPALADFNLWSPAWPAASRRSKTRDILVADGLLTPGALVRLRRFCTESLIWNSNKMAGYVGSYLFDGFYCGLLFQVAHELRQRLPQLLEGTFVKTIWAFNCESPGRGLPVHADPASVTVNLWITPDRSNLDQAGGGLAIYDRQPPKSWGETDYRALRSADRCESYLARSGASKITIPHRMNRAIVFPSMNFHNTDAFRFRTGHLDRRINISFLYSR